MNHHVRWFAVVAAVIALVAKSAIAEARRTAATLAPHTLMSIDVEVGGPALLAMGDTLLLVARRYRCVGDVCDRASVPALERPHWASSDSTIASTPRIGDTIHVAVIARDSTGGTVAEIAPVAHVGGTGATGEVGWPPAGSTKTTVVIDHAGLLVLVARLAQPQRYVACPHRQVTRLRRATLLAREMNGE